MNIRIFVRLHRYRQHQILMLSESITPWVRPIRRVTSWLDPPSLCTTLPRNVKFLTLRSQCPRHMHGQTVQFHPASLQKPEPWFDPRNLKSQGLCLLMQSAGDPFDMMTTEMVGGFYPSEESVPSTSHSSILPLSLLSLPPLLSLWAARVLSLRDSSVPAHG